MSAAQPGLSTSRWKRRHAGFVPEGERAEILAGVLAGIELSAWDRRIAEWLAGWDASTVLPIASWIARSRMVRRQR